MQTRLSNFKIFVWLTLLGMALTACSVGQAPDQPTAQIIQETVVVVVTATPPPTSSLPSPQSTDIPGPAAEAATATEAPPLQPSPTPLHLVNIPIEGGDSNHMFPVTLVFPDYNPAATTSLWFRVYAHSPMSIKVDGEGIVSVEFQILDWNGNQVHDRVEKTASYCAFGGGEPDCIVWDFASNHYQWPDGSKIESGYHSYTIKITAISKDQVEMHGQAQFNVQAP
ncbi:MAG TPA: hypothetical protein VF355_07070 [Anaerolineaceae bacterium]|jgi:hypothetical protein